MMDPKIISAVEFLATLRTGDPVTLTENGQEHAMYVSRELRRSDGAFGSYESSHVTVTFGPGRYATEARAELIAAGRQKIARRAS